MRSPVIRVELAALRDEDRLTPDLVFRDPYFLDFLGLPQRYLERDLEDAILSELEAFLLELGTDFAFVARQKRISVDGDDYIDKTPGGAIMEMVVGAVDHLNSTYWRMSWKLSCGA